MRNWRTSCRGARGMGEMEESRIPTFASGFDEIIGGGIPARSIVLISGDPGTMKSSFAMSILRANSIRNGLRSLYVSLEQSRESLIRQMKLMDLDIEGDSNIEIVDLSSIREELERASQDDTLISVLREFMTYSIKKHGSSLLVVDSLDVLELSSGTLSRRSQMYFLFEWLRELKMTSLLISETNPDDVLQRGFEEGYMADGIINLSLAVAENDSVRRRIRCVKMRNTIHETSYYSLQFARGRFTATQSLG